MKVCEKFTYLALSRQDTKSPYRVIVDPSREQIIRQWNPSTRISPLYCVTNAGVKSSIRHQFNSSWLVFIGPRHPLYVLNHCPKPDQFWLSLGLYNNILSYKAGKDASRATTWASKNNVPYELWKIEQGYLVNDRCWNQSYLSSSVLKEMARISASSSPSELHEAINEYLPLMASTISRGSALPSHKLNDLRAINALAVGIISSFNKRPDGSFETTSLYQALGQFLTLNAGLSRFSSQTFAGSSPITRTECHFWSHSLLGIGVAIFAFLNLRKFIENTIGAARLPERFVNFCKIKDGIPNLQRENPPGGDYLSRSEVSVGDTEPLVPLLPYFSSRDGYHSTETTISAPLASVSSCNCLRWSLMTITHEVSHVIIRSIVAELYPDLRGESDAGLGKCLDLIDSRIPGDSLFSEIRRIFLLSIIDIDVSSSVTNNQRREAIQINVDDLKKLLERWRHEVDETMTHTFDFLYFYGRDVKRYVSGIWASWGTIPNVVTRIPEYVVRTICAVLSVNLNRGENAEDYAKDVVLRELKDLQTKDLGGRYVEEAVRYIENNWNEEAKHRVRARRQIVKLVRTYLFSEKIATDVRAEPSISGGAAEKEGYTLKKGVVEERKIRNPLRFIEMFTTSAHASVSDSVWMLYTLAFSIDGDDY